MNPAEHQPTPCLGCPCTCGNEYLGWYTELLEGQIEILQEVLRFQNSSRGPEDETEQERFRRFTHWRNEQS
jgi:hypothetical protein